MCTYSDIPVKLNWVMLEECWVPCSPITSWVCYHKCAHPAILRARIRALNSDSSPGPSAQPVQEEKKFSHGTVHRSSRKGGCVSKCHSLPPSKHVGNFLPVAAFHGSVPSWTPFSMVTMETEAPSQHHQAFFLKEPCSCCICTPWVQLGLWVSAVQNWILSWWVNAIDLPGTFQDWFWKRRSGEATQTVGSQQSLGIVNAFLMGLREFMKDFFSLNLVAA